MSTVATIVNRSMRLLGQIGQGASPTTSETADAIVALNSMLDSWRNDRLMCFAFQTESLTLSASTASYTIGSGGTLNTTRPVEIVEAYILDNDQSYPVTPMNEAEYAGLFQKTLSGDWPDRYLFRPTAASSQATLIVYPVPNATRTLKLTTRVNVTAFSASTDTVTLPPGWEEALAANLAIRLAPEFQVQVTPEVRLMAKESLGGIKRTNAAAQPKELRTSLGVMFGANHASIVTDEVR